jgi:PAS domain S-box-containing protein
MDISNDENEQHTVLDNEELRHRIFELDVRKRELEDSNRELSERVQMFQHVLESIPQKIFFKDVDSVYVSCNPLYAEDLGIKSSEIAGKTDFDFYPSELAEKYIEDDKRIIRTGEGETIDEQYMIDEGEFWVRTTKKVVTNEHGDTLGILGIFEDITQRKMADTQLRNIMAELVRSNNELEQFAYVASHDLQEPLRMISSYVQLLQRRYEGKLDKDADDFIHYAVDGVERMQRLIDDLLVYSRVNTRGQPFTETDLNEVLKGVLLDLSPTIKKSGATVTHEKLPVIMADPTQMGQVLLNLIGNALKFHGAEAPEVHLRSDRTEEGWTFTVADNGIGIDQKFHERIFVIFQRLHGATQYKGTGIGLAVTKKIVERHRGRIWVDSNPGMGSIFRFTINTPHPDAEQE